MYMYFLKNNQAWQELMAPMIIEHQFSLGTVGVEGLASLQQIVLATSP